jgi:hypothetical protein
MDSDKKARGAGVSPACRRRRQRPIRRSSSPGERCRLAPAGGGDARPTRGSGFIVGESAEARCGTKQHQHERDALGKVGRPAGLSGAGVSARNAAEGGNGRCRAASSIGAGHAGRRAGTPAALIDLCLASPRLSMSIGLDESPAGISTFHVSVSKPRARRMPAARCIGSSRSRSRRPAPPIGI